MSLRRLGEVFRLTFARQLKRPLLWVLVVLLALTAWGLSSGKVHISSGDSDVGGTKAWITSQFALAQMLSILVFLYYAFFAAVASGMLVIQDDEHKVGELLHATPLRPLEYVWGKFLGVLAAFLVVLGLHLLFHAVSNHLLAGAEAEEYIGPFSAWNYLRPALIFALPQIVFFAGSSFALGAWTRRPIPVFFLPAAALLVSLFFLWDWTPSWLDPRVDRVLMAIDVAGLRWLSGTWLEVDRGVAFYNHEPIAVDGWFAASRIAFVALGLALVHLSGRSFAAALRGRKAARRPAAAALAPRDELVEGAAPRPLAELGMSARRPGFVRAMLEVTRVELRELKSQPGLYLFVPLILLETLSVALFQVGAFDTPVLATPGTLAASSMNTLTLLVCLLLLFYTVESLERERGRGLDSIYYATPVRSASILFGKSLANSLVGALILLAALLACVVVLLVQGQVGFELRPFLLLWGLLLVPTFFAWCSFVTAVYSLARNRYAAYAAGLAALVFTGYRQVRGQMNWAGNWDLWSAVRWSDLGALELDTRALWLNRLGYLAVGAACTVLAVRLFPRRSFDAATLLHRLRPRALARSALLFAPWAIAPAVLLGLLWRDVEAGREGGAIEKRAKDYWRKNLATWKDAPQPSIVAVELELDLEPERSRFRAAGSYELFNDRPEALRQIPVTPGPHFEDRHWTLDGETVEPEDRAGLLVFTPQAPLAPGERLRLGFRHHGRLPKGISKNGAGLDEFILPSGAVLTSFTPSIVPVLGFVEEYGIDEDNRYDAREYPDDFYEGVTESGFGNNLASTTRITVRLPEAYQANSVGVLVSDEVAGGVRTVVWHSDHPVEFFNVVAGKWAVRRGQGTAIYYHPSHAYNIDEMLAALDGARRFYAEWFHPYPWRELKLSEFATHATYAQGFPTDITFSEGIGFLTRSEPRAQAAFLVTAHEAAHQWWGNLLVPGKGPGGDILSEGMSHFSTILLMGEVLGPRERIEFCKGIESRYGDRRQTDSERPLVRCDGSRAGDETVTYDKGGWVFWMLLDHMGRERALEGLRQFLKHYHNNPDHPVLQDFVAAMRPFAPDEQAYDDFVQQWFFQVVVPEYELRDARRERAAGSGAWKVALRVKNKGTGFMPVEVAAVRGERFPEDEEPSRGAARDSGVQAAESGSPKEAYREARATLALAPGEEQALEIACDFEPEQVLVDPDARVLQLQRKLAIVRF